MSRFAIAAVPTSLAALAGALWFVTFDEGGIRRGDLGYYVFIPRKVRNLPLIAACDEAIFGYQTNDSLEPETMTMDYSSRAFEAELKAAYEKELAAWSCLLQNSGSSVGSMTFICSSPSVRVSLVTAGNPTAKGCRPTHLEFLFGAT